MERERSPLRAWQGLDHEQIRLDPLDHIAEGIAGIRRHHAGLDFNAGAEERRTNLFEPGVEIPQFLASGCGDRRGEWCFGNGDGGVLGPQKLERAVQKMRDVLAGLQSKNNATQDIGGLERSWQEQKVARRGRA